MRRPGLLGSAGCARLCVTLLLFGCTTIPPKFITSGHHPVLDRDGGVNLSVDVCIQYDAVGEADDRFLGFDSKAVASEFVKVATSYFLAKHIQVLTMQVPFVCGALHSAGNPAQPFAVNVGEAPSLAKQPFAVDDALQGDPDHTRALSTVATYVFQHAVAKKDGPGARNVFAGPMSASVGPHDFKVALAAVTAKTKQPHLLALIVTGTRESEGQTALKAVGRVGLALATGGLVGVATLAISDPVDDTAVGAKFNVTLNQVVAGLVDAKAGELVWVNGVDWKPTVSQQDLVDALFFDLVHRPGNTWTPPGAPRR